MDRRQFLKATGAAGVTGLAGMLLPPGLARAASVISRPGAGLADIEHIVVLMQENRSFDQYFGTMSGVIGYDDPTAVTGVFKQNDLNLAGNPSGYVLPWHTDTATTSAQAHGALNHSWPAQHLMWNDGGMDMFVTAQNFDASVMGHYRRADLPYHFALADNFTVCDRYFCSVFGPTNPNRIMLMSGTVDAEGTKGGPCLENTQQAGQLKWKSVPELLEDKGVSWYLYQESDNYDDNMLPFFEGFSDTSTALYAKGNSVIPSPPGQPLGTGLTEQLKSDVLAGRLPQVSYIVGPQETSEHPNSGPGRGAQFIDQVLEALTSDLDVWSRTLVILNYDENDGAFDHVLPPTPPPGTAGEWLTGSVADAKGFNGPVGLGFRVPMILISPFTRGPLVSSDVFDHTSIIQLLEARFGIACPQVSAWRRSTVGDLTSAINFAASPTADFPALPDGDALAAEAVAQSSLPAPTRPVTQSMPTQERFPLRGRPSGPVAAPTPLPSAGPPAPGTSVSVASVAAAHSAGGQREALAATGTPSGVAGAAVALGAVGLLATRLRDRLTADRAPDREDVTATTQRGNIAVSRPW